jgi:glycosyltransferase involved in cell wall biosynthesis
VAVWLGSPSTEPFLCHIAPALLAEHRRSGLRLRVISAGTAPLGDLDAMTDRVAWAPSVAERTLASADVGLMPLPDDPWTRGKCGYKLLQYAAAGLPVIGSPVGVNNEVLRELGGLGATTTAEWADALRLVVDGSEDERAAMGARALSGVEREFSFRRWADEWRRAVLGEVRTR